MPKTTLSGTRIRALRLARGMTQAELARAGITLGTTYPEPVIDHSRARERALAAFATLKGAA